MAPLPVVLLILAVGAWFTLFAACGAFAVEGRKHGAREMTRHDRTALLQVGAVAAFSLACVAGALAA